LNPELFWLLPLTHFSTTERPKLSRGVCPSVGTTGDMIGFALFAVLVAMGVFIFIPRQPQLMEPVLHHAATTIEHLLTESQARELRRVLKEEIKVFKNIAKDNKFYKMKHEHIGEAVPMVNGVCQHPYMVPNADGDLCILPGRVDVGQHFARSGGYEGFKENFATTLSRLQSFAHYIFDMDQFAITKALFESDSFTRAAQTVCPSDEQYIDGFQMNLLVQVPGQTVAAHTDAPYFWGASRFLFPQWLLIAMTHSGLFRDKYINQVRLRAGGLCVVQ
jgi:hypothetical protein